MSCCGIVPKIGKGILKEVCIRMSWPLLILQLENHVVEFIARWHHLFYKILGYKFNRCVHNNTVLKYSKNHATWFRHFEEVDSQT